MHERPELSMKMTQKVFENNYWYALELKTFAIDIGIPAASRMRKEQLEAAIGQFLHDGKISQAALHPKRNALSQKDYETTPLSSSSRIINYTGDKTTKTFIQAEAKRRQPNFKKKSAVWYWLNRWREDQLKAHRKITYGDLVEQFLVLSNIEGRLPRIPSTKFNNFISDFLAANAGNRSEALAAWEVLKKLNCPKTFAAWKKNKT